MRVLVTGVDGYIGVWMAKHLHDRGHEVVGLDTGFFRDGWLYDEGVHSLLKCLDKDIRRITPEDVRGFDAVVHLSELSNDPLGELSPHITHQINHAGSVALANACKQAGVERFLYSSSCSVYGVGTEEFMTEESATNPQTVYACCKLMVERDLAALADDNFSPTFLRNATACGPSPRMRFDLVLNNLAALAWTKRQITMTSDGTPWRPLIYVRDICEAFACVLEMPRQSVHNEIFNVGDTTQNYQVRDIAEVVASTFPGCGLSFGPASADNRSYRVSFEKIANRLPNFRCRCDLPSAARELRAVFEKIGLSSEMFEFRAYTRVRQLQHLLQTGQISDNFFWLEPFADTAKVGRDALPLLQ